MMKAQQLAHLIRQFSEDLPTKGKTLPPKAIAQIAAETNLRGWQIESQALERGVMPLRYSRNAQSITITDQRKLLESSVAIVGLGGLGGITVETLARLGVGRIRAADHDSFEPGNLNRQALASMDTLGQPKAEVARQRIAEINPSVEFEAQTVRLDDETMTDFLTDADIVLDALGGLEMRRALEQAASKTNVPLVSGALAGWTGYIATIMPDNSGPAQIMGTNNAAEEKLGCLPMTVNYVSALMVNECVRLLCTGKSPVSGHMLLIDLATLTQELVLI